MVVAGPNAKDFHYNETEELFYQLEGSITIITQENGERNVLELHAGDMYLHLQSTPPSRSEGSIGLVIERKEQDKAILTVYCGIASCNHKLRYTLS
jgi:3-hydroxyanthranilate 3,4-dioxygenase